MVLRHVVSWKLNGTTREERDEQASRVVAMLEPLKHTIPEVRALAVYRNELHEDVNFDVTLIADFDDAAGLAAYAVHPEHLLAIELMKEVASARAGTDFTV